MGGIPNTSINVKAAQTDFLTFYEYRTVGTVPCLDLPRDVVIARHDDKASEAPTSGGGRHRRGLLLMTRRRDADGGAAAEYRQPCPWPSALPWTE